MTASLPKVAMDVPPALLLPPAKRYRRILEGRGGRVYSGSCGAVYVAIDLATNAQAGRREARAWGPHAWPKTKSLAASVLGYSRDYCTQGFVLLLFPCVVHDPS